MRALDKLPQKPPVRRICADFHGEASVEVDMLEVQIGIHRAARNKSERDAALMEIALLSLKKHVEAFSAMTGEKYPDYRLLAEWLERGADTVNGDPSQHLAENPTTAHEVPMVAHDHDSRVASE
jgi:hypothetical protein